MIKKIKRRLYLLIPRAIFFIKIKLGFHKVDSLEDFLERKSKNNSKRVWIIGNGPSLKIEDLERIPENDITIVANKFYKIFHLTTFRPDVVVSSDEQVLSDFGERILKEYNDSFIAFLSDYIRPFGGNQYLRVYKSIKLKKGKSKSYYNGGGSLFLGIQLMFSIGYKDFVLLGIDHDFDYLVQAGDKSFSEGNHMVENYRDGKPWIPPRISQIENSFKLIKSQLETNNGSIFNSSRKTKLPHIKKKEFELFL
jgi:hypothetical protein